MPLVSGKFANQLFLDGNREGVENTIIHLEREWKTPS